MARIHGMAVRHEGGERAGDGREVRQRVGEEDGRPAARGVHRREPPPMAGAEEGFERIDCSELGRGHMDVGRPVGVPGSPADESITLARYVNITPVRALLATLAVAVGLSIGYVTGIAIVDALEWLMNVGTALGANPFGWSL